MICLEQAKQTVILKPGLQLSVVVLKLRLGASATALS